MLLWSITAILAPLPPPPRAEVTPTTSPSRYPVPTLVMFTPVTPPDASTVIVACAPDPCPEIGNKVTLV